MVKKEKMGRREKIKGKNGSEKENKKEEMKAEEKVIESTDGWK